MIRLEHRGSARQRGYDARWDRAAAAFKAQHPICLGCQAVGQAKATQVVDHVEPHRGDMTKFWNAEMWQPSCAWHHDVIKKQLEAMYDRGAIGVVDLWLSSEEAVKLTHRRRPKAVGLDGWPAA